MSNDSNFPDTARLEQYLAGDCTPDEAAEIAEWIGADPVRQTMAIGLKALDKTHVDRQTTVDVDALWSRVRNQTTTPRPAPGQTSRPSFPLRRQVVRYSGLLIATLVVLLAGYTAVSRIVSSSTGKPSEYHEYTTGIGQVGTVTLGDGTRVTLAPGSVLRYAQSFGTNGRDVYLHGEAYFDIAHRPTQPFVVFTDHSSTQVLGTQFTVRQYVEDTTVHVAVMTGKVALIGRGGSGARSSTAPMPVTSARDAVIVSGGEQAVLLPGGQIALTSDSEGRSEPSWLSGRLVYHNAPLRDVVAGLQRWYGITFHLRDAALGDLRLTASFEDTTFTADALAGITTSLGLDFERHGDRIVLFSK